MFLPENVKKYTNVSTVCLKRGGKKYEVVLYPNKYHEYKNGLSTISEILVNTNIYKNVSKGEVWSKDDLKVFNKPYDLILKEILDSGCEQKNSKTREYENKQKELETLEYVKKCVRDPEGKLLTDYKITQTVGKLNITNKPIKVQAKSIIKKLLENGFLEAKMKIHLQDLNTVSEEKIKILSEKFKEFFDTKNSSVVLIPFRLFKEFREFCEENKIEYKIAMDTNTSPL